MGNWGTGSVVGDWPLQLEMTRPWFHGVAILAATGATGEGPEELGDAIGAACDAGTLFAATPWSAAVMVRLAQDVDEDDEDDDEAIAQATVTVRCPDGGRMLMEDAQFDTVLVLPEGALEIGDPMGNVAIDSLGPRVRVRMRVREFFEDVAQHVEVELTPAPAVDGA